MKPGIIMVVGAALLFALAQSPARAAKDWPALKVYAPDEPPSNFVDKKTGETTGFTTEVVRAIMAKLGQSWPIEIQPWSRIYHQAQTQPNVVLFRAARIAKREKLFQWVGPISNTPMILFAAKGKATGVGTLDDARAVKRIAVMKNDVREQMLKALKFTNLDASIDHEQGLKKLLNGRVELWASAENAAAKRIKAMGKPADTLRPTVTFGNVFGYIVISKDTDPSVAARWQAALDAVKADGTFAAIAEKWAKIQGIGWEMDKNAAHFLPQ